MSLALVFSAVLIAMPKSNEVSSTGVSMEYETKLFQKNTVNQIDIAVDSSAWNTMLNEATSEEYIMCDITINGTKFSSVGIRPKGNSSLSTVASDSTTDRFSFKLEFDHYVNGQTCWGLDKFVLNNMQSDNTYMKEYLSYDILSFIGVTSPLYSYAHITVNGEEWGLYLAVEGVEESFAERNYGTAYGQLYKPENMGMRGNGQMNDILDQMNQNGDDQSKMQMSPFDSQNGTDSGTQNMPQMPGQNGTDSGGGMPQTDSGTMQPPDWNNSASGSESGGGFQQGGNMPNMPDGAQNGMGGGMGGMGSGNSQGVDLAYTDDDSDSYSNIFDNAVFSSAKENDFQRVIQALKGLSTGENLEDYVDVDQVLRYIAANTVIVNLDSYFGSMQHNYYLYEKDGVLSMVPWDYNLAFGGFQSGSAESAINLAINTPVSGTTLDARPMIGKLLENEEYLAKYHEYLQEIVTNYFDNGTFESTVDSLGLLIDDCVKNDATAFCTYEEFTASLPVLKEFGTLRAQSIQGQLDGTIPSTSDGQSADSSALIQTDLNLSTLGTQGGNMGGGKGNEMDGSFRGQQNGSDTLPETSSQASSSEQNSVTQSAVLKSATVTNMVQQTQTAAAELTGNMNNMQPANGQQTPPQMPGNATGTTSGSEGQTPPQMPGNQDGTISGSEGQTSPQMPGNQGDKMPDGMQQTQAAPTNLSGLWVMLAFFAAIVAGIVFAIFYRRRRTKNIL